MGGYLKGHLAMARAGALFLVAASFLLVAVFVGMSTVAGDASVTPAANSSPIAFTAPNHNALINISINNTALCGTEGFVNITQINVTLPSGYKILSGTGMDGSSRTADFTRASDTVAKWNNTAVNIINCTFSPSPEYFWFNVSVANISGTRPIEVWTMHTTGTSNSTNYSAKVSMPFLIGIPTDYAKRMSHCPSEYDNFCNVPALNVTGTETLGSKDEFYYDGNYIDIVLNMTRPGTIIGVAGLNITANFSSVGGSAIKEATDLGNGIYNLRDTVDYSSLPSGQLTGENIIKGANITINITNETNHLASSYWDLQSTIAVLVNMSVMPGCPVNANELPPSINWEGTQYTTSNCSTDCSTDYAGSYNGNDPIFPTNSSHVTLCGPTFGGATTNISNSARYHNMSNMTFIIDIPGKAKIQFNQNISFGNQTQMGAIMQFAVRNLMSNGMIGINETEWSGGSKPNLNFSATLTIYNANTLLGLFGNDPSVLFGSFNGNALPSDLSVCPRGKCDPNAFIFDGENLTFTVTSFSTYTAGSTNYSIIYENLTVIESTVYTNQNASYTVNLTNNGSSATDIYNLSLSTNATSTAYINDTSINLNSTIVGGINNHTQVLVNVESAVTGVYWTYIVANFWNGTDTNYSWSLNSSDDGIMLKTTVQSPTVTIAVPASNSNMTAASGVTLGIVNVTELEWCNISINNTINLSFLNCVNRTINPGNFSNSTAQFITVYANDTLGNYMTANVTGLTIDSARPSALSSVYPEAGWYVNGTIKINVSVVDAISGVKNASFTIGNSNGPQAYGALSRGEAGTIGNGYWNTTFNTATLFDGAYNISFNASDFNGNFNTTYNITLTIDNNEPNVTVKSPANGSRHIGTILVNLTANDTGSGVDTVRYWLSNTTKLYQSGYIANDAGIYYTITLNVSNLTTGLFTLNITVNDTIGQANDTTTLNMTIETPSFSVSSPSSSTNLTGIGGVAVVMLNNTELEWCNISINNTINLSFLNCVNRTIAPGNFSNSSGQIVTVYANDTNGNYFTVNVTGLTLDAVSPSVQIWTPQNITNQSRVIHIIVNSTDTLSGVKSVAYTLSNSTKAYNTGSLSYSTGTLASSNWTGSVDVANMTDGNYTLTINATDYALNSNTSYYYFITITNVPILTVRQPFNTTYTNASIEMNVTGNEPLNAVWVQLLGTNSSNMTNTSGQWQLFNGTLSDGQYNATFWYNDTEGHANSSTVYFMIDTTAPTATVSASPTTITAGESVTLSCSTSDATSGIASSGFTVLKPDGNTVSGTGTFTDTGLSGTYTVSCSAIDNAGNTASSTDTFIASGSTTGGGTTGGSSSGGSSTPQVISFIRGFDKIEPGAAVSVGITKEGIDVKNIEIEVVNKVQSVTITVSKLSGQPASVTKTASGKEYSYIEIKNPKITSSNIKSARIDFEVEKSWINDNNIDKNKVYLNRYANGDWERLSTTMVSEDSENVNYQADTPGFSYFVITGEEVAAEQPGTDTGLSDTNIGHQQDQDTGQQNTTPPATQPSGGDEQQGDMGFILIIIVAVLIIIVITVVILRMKV